MSRSRRFLGGLIPTYVYQAAIMVTGIWLTPFFLSSLGQRDYGLWIVGTQLLLYLTLTDFGVVALLPVEAAAATGRGGGAQNAHDLSLVVAQTVRIVLYQLPIVIALAIAIWFVIPVDWQGLRGPLAILLVGFVVSFPLRILPALLYGLQDLAFANTMQIVSWALSTAITVALVLMKWKLYALAIGWVVGQTVLTPFFVYRIWSRFPNTVPRQLPGLAWETVKRQLGQGFWVSLAQVATLLVANTDVLIIAKLLGPAAVVPYACTGKLCMVLGNQVTILMHNAGPGLCELKAGESRQRLFEVVIALSRGVFLFSGLVFCVVLLVNHWFVNWWVTAHQYGGLMLSVLFLLNLVIRHWTGMTANSVFYFGHQRRISLTNITDGIVTAATILIFVKVWGVAGALMGSIAGAVLVSLPLNLSVIARDAGVKIAQLTAAMLGGWLWRFALLAGVAGWIASRWSPKTLLEGAATTVAAAAVYCAVMFPSALRGPLGTYVRPVIESFRVRYIAFRSAAPSSSS
jgi:O-antigen/teichoic acid export membrane protein